MYIYWAALSAIFIALSSLIRGIESGTPLPVKFSLSVVWFTCSLIMLAYYRWYKLGSDFQLPWFRQIASDPASKRNRRFSWGQFTAIMAGGISEFTISVCVIMTLNAAQKANINQGIGLNIMICNSVLVTLLSYCLLGERVSKTQMAGIVVIVIGVALVSLFPPESEISD